MCAVRESRFDLLGHEAHAGCGPIDSADEFSFGLETGAGMLDMRSIGRASMHPCRCCCAASSVSGCARRRRLRNSTLSGPRASPVAAPGIMQPRTARL